MGRGSAPPPSTSREARRREREELIYVQDFATLQSPEARLAELMVEAWLGGGNSELLPDGPPCTCGVGDVDDIVDGKTQARIHHSSCAGNPAKSKALRPPEPIVEWPDRYGAELKSYPVLKQLMIRQRSKGETIDRVYNWAGLKKPEADALAMHHTGFQLAAIAKQLRREDTAVKQLIWRGVWRLERALFLVSEPPQAAPHCEICAEARADLQAAPKLKTRSA